MICKRKKIINCTSSGSKICFADTVKTINKQATDWEKVSNYLYPESLSLYRYKNSYNSVTIKKWAKDLNRHFTEEVI